ncbi:MAG: hypothetical protein ACOYO1_07820 [Bacteroidales bacterium]
MRRIVIFVTVIIFFTSCKNNDVVTNSLYCWNQRDSYDVFSKDETKAIFDNGIKKIYFRLSDVVWNKEYHAEPVNINKLPLNHAIANYAEIVPCMFFTNEVMIKSTKDELEFMAQKIAMKVNSDSVHEFQLDCDWSDESREHYFYFIQTLKPLLNSNICLTATIRLYQYKYPDKAGIPPVDRGMLMLYNFNIPKKYDAKNAIFELDEAKKYMGNKHYKLPLDFAVAHFKWRILYDIDNTFIAYVNQSDADILIENSVSSANNSVYIINNDVSIEGYFARKGQKLAIHQADYKTLKQSYSLIKKLKNTREYAIAVFDMNETTVKYLLSDESLFKEINH